MAIFALVMVVVLSAPKPSSASPLSPSRHNDQFNPLSEVDAADESKVEVEGEGRGEDDDVEGGGEVGMRNRLL